MAYEQTVYLHSAEMTEHANVDAQYLDALLGGRYVTKEQSRNLVDYLFAGTKRNSVSCPFVTKEQNNAEIHCRKILLNTLKTFIRAVDEYLMSQLSVEY